jgi:hypothetical protein
MGLCNQVNKLTLLSMGVVLVPEGTLKVMKCEHIMSHFQEIH